MRLTDSMFRAEGDLKRQREWKSGAGAVCEHHCQIGQNLPPILAPLGPTRCSQYCQITREIGPNLATLCVSQRQSGTERDKQREGIAGSRHHRHLISRRSICCDARNSAAILEWGWGAA